MVKEVKKKNNGMQEKKETEEEKETACHWWSKLVCTARNSTPSLVEFSKVEPRRPVASHLSDSPFKVELGFKAANLSSDLSSDVKQPI